MKPILLYAANATSFNSNGIGALTDAISAVVTEERNGIFELTITYPITGKRFGDLSNSMIIKSCATPNGDYQLFRIYDITKPMNGIVTIHAEHISYQLAYIAVAPFTATTAAEAIYKIGANAMSTCPFTFWTDKSVTANYKQETPANIRSRLGGTQGSILDVYGGEYEFDNYTVKLHTNRGQNRNVTLRYGKNITDIEQEENIGSVYTSIVGYWKSEDDLVQTDVINHDNAAYFPYTRTAVVDFSSEWQEAPTVQQLTARATSYMTANKFGVPKVSIKVSFVALWQTEEYKNVAPLERVYLCDTVNVYYEKLGITAAAKVVKTQYNVLLDRYNSIELGETKTNLARRLASNVGDTQQAFEDTKSLLEKSIIRATDLITGNKGGHVIFVYDANGKPQEICIMDTEDITTAEKVWRWNLSGLGYSKVGYNPPAGTAGYRLAMTMDGHIVADFVDTGVLTANIIKAGILGDTGAGKNYWNMETGELQLQSTVKVGSSTIASQSDVSTGVDTAKTYTSTAISNYDTALNQKKVFDKLTNNAQNTGIYMKANDNTLYINATYVATGILTGKYAKFALNMDTGEFTMKDGTLEGVTIQSAESATSGVSNARLKLDNTTSIKGYYGDTMHNLINFEQVVSGTHQMTIDADTQLNIRTPHLYVSDQSAGTSTSTVYETITQTDQTMGQDTEYYSVSDLGKVEAGESYQGLTAYEGYVVGTDEDDWWVYCTLPVYIKYTATPLKYIHGMLIGDGTADARVF